MSLVIQPIRSLFDLKRLHDIQHNTWGYRDAMIIPYTHMITAHHNGGTLLGAYWDGELVGFVYGYLGMAGGSLYLFSQRMGVLPAFQSKGVGTRLKLAQREQMLRQGIDLIVWTYDPLEGPNAMLNIEKLGGFVRTYVREIYGRMVENPLQAGLAMDRFMLEWHLLNDRVRGRIAGNYERSNVRDWLENKKYRLVNFANWNSDLPRPIAADLEMDEHVLLVQVPANIHAIRRRDLSVARGWRKNTREIFETYFRRGYVITGFATEMEPNAPNIYKMENVSFPAPIDFSLWATGIDDSTNDSEDEED